MSDYPHTDSETLVDLLAHEALMKRGWGDPRLEVSIPISWIEDFDLLSNFRYQNPFGLSSIGAGEQARYYYIESITYDFIGQKMDIIAVDLQFILRQIMIVAHCDDVEEKWENAGEADRMYAYVGDCETESFESDGSPLKRMISCRSLE